MFLAPSRDLERLPDVHPIDHFLLCHEAERSGNLRAWKMPQYAPDDPDGIRLARALLRLPAAVEERICRAPSAFLASLQIPDSAAARTAWTEPVENCLVGATVQLLLPEPLLYLEWRAWDDDDREFIDRLEAVTLTPDRALVLFSIKPVDGDAEQAFGDVPWVVGMITRTTPTRSLALLLSRMETRLIPLEVLTSEPASDLPWAEVVRVTWASSRRHLPLVLDMTPEALELVYPADKN